MFELFRLFGRRAWGALLLLAVCCGVIGAARAADDFLDPAVAFRFSASEQPGEVDVRYKIADGYYMYRERFAFAVKSGDAITSRSSRDSSGPV